MPTYRTCKACGDLHEVENWPDNHREWIIDKLADVFAAISMESEPERACPRMDHWESKFCSFYKECWKVLL
jgi:hypothetical protein